MDKVSYALGLSIGNNFQNSGINDLQIEDFVKGLKDILGGQTPEISYDEAKQVINDYFMKLQKEKFEINKKAGEEFLNINKGKAGVVTLPSGLQYQVLQKGEGPKPTASDKMCIRDRYSYLRGRPGSDARDYRCGEGGGSLCDHCGGCGCNELCEPYRTGGASFYPVEYLSLIHIFWKR